jgi:hypothetical protein
MIRKPFADSFRRPPPVLAAYLCPSCFPGIDNAVQVEAREELPVFNLKPLIRDPVMASQHSTAKCQFAGQAEILAFIKKLVVRGAGPTGESEVKAKGSCIGCGGRTRE